VQAAIGRRLREWRLRKRQSQAAIASVAGITQPSLSNYESGRRGPSLITAMRLAVALGISLTVLVQGLENLLV
jgi:transcriptional regulator with XRE-family HTH domain